MDATTITELMIVELDSAAIPDPEKISTLRNGSGIDEVNVEGNKIHIVFQPYVVSREGVLSRMENARIDVRINGDNREQQKRPGFLRRFIDRMAAENRRSLGSGRLDCCDLNRKNRP
ncbi:MAG: LDCC motif putative metal-binding protein [Alkalispirochaeta sp.]